MGFTEDSLEYKKSGRRFLLVGNIGTHKRGLDKTFGNAFKQTLERYSEEDYVLLLGNSLTSNMTEKSTVVQQVESISDMVTKFEGKKIIIPGRNEWKPKGSDGLNEVEDYFDEKLGKDNYFEPEKGCPLETVDVDEDTEIIIVDSQWYIENWDVRPGMNDKCEIKTRTRFLIELKDKIKKAGHKNILLVMYHPLYSNGFFGGRISKDVWYKPSNENAFIPGVGILWSALRAQGGISSQDRQNPLMNELMSEIETAAKLVPRIFIISSHERSLQYIKQDNVRQIISGTASTSRGASLGKNGWFTSGEIGMAELTLLQDGSSKVNFYRLGDADQFEQIYSDQGYPKSDHYPIEDLPNDFEETYATSIYPIEQTKVDSKFERKWGKHYRYIYSVKVKAPVAILDTLYGGLTVERAGGGNQTQSLRLVDKDDREYNMRALAKDPISFLQASGYNDLNAHDYFDGTLTAELISDFYTAAHPYGAFVVAALAHEVGIKHTHPELFYVPKQRALGDFNYEHGDRLYMIEQKPDDDFEDSHMFGRSDEIINTQELFEEIRDDENNQVNEEEYIRARIFDMLLGDWDRHEGQWSWAGKEVDEKTIYVPVPRDRDQVFANFDGRFLKTLQKIVGRTRQFGRYGEDIEFVEQFSESAINLDRAILQRSNKQVWREQVSYIQENLGEEAVKRAFSQVPTEIKDEVWERIQTYLLLRKGKLGDIVERYLDYFQRFQSLKGTDKDDLFIIEGESNGDIHVEAYRIKDGAKGSMLFNKTYKENETENLWVFGLDDTDVFKISGLKKSKIKVTIIGGLNDDTYNIEEGRGILIYDQKGKDDKFVNRGGAQIRLSNNYSNRIYDSEIRPSSGKIAKIAIGYDPDQGIFPEMEVGLKNMGFERNPFTSLFLLNVRYISLTQAVDIRPEFHMSNLLERFNLKLAGRITSNNYTKNFFGFGNESTNDLNTFDANRIFTQYLQFGASVYRKGPYGSSFILGAKYKNITTEESEFVTLDNALGSRNYLEIGTSYKFESLDDDRFTTKGLLIRLQAKLLDNLENIPTTIAFDQKISLWNALGANRKLVLKNTIWGQLRAGDEIPFYHASIVGSDSGLRSFRENRFTGDHSLGISTDLNYRFKPLKTSLFPLRMSSSLGYDVAKVWSGAQKSDIWHTSFGGGMKLEMAALVNLDMNYFYGKEGGRLSFTFRIGM
ncbi:MAG: hypothetical protein WBG90_21960 [Saonia sp.]